MKKTTSLFFCYIVILFSSCGPVADLSMGGEIDVRPPQFICIKAIAADTIEIVFDESASLEPETLRISPLLEVANITTVEFSVIIQTHAMKIGEKYSLAAVMSDQKSNSLSFGAIFYGYNRINRISSLMSLQHKDPKHTPIL